MEAPGPSALCEYARRNIAPGRGGSQQQHVGVARGREGAFNWGMRNLLPAKVVKNLWGFVLLMSVLSVPLHINATRWGVSCDGKEIVRVWPLGVGTGDPAQIAWATEIPGVIASICAGYPMYLSIFTSSGGDRTFTLIIGVIFPVVALFIVAGVMIGRLGKRLRSPDATQRRS